MEIVASSRAYDLHQKKEAYRRNGVREYLAWIVEESRVAWWELREGAFVELVPDVDGCLQSRVFPGLWLDAAALLRGDLSAVFAALQRGLSQPSVNSIRLEETVAELVARHGLAEAWARFPRRFRDAPLTSNSAFGRTGVALAARFRPQTRLRIGIRMGIPAMRYADHDRH